jgi:ATP-dependent RNA helicase RhlE
MSFKQFNLNTQIETGIEALGYTAPTPIQLQSMPAILQGKDVMGPPRLRFPSCSA